MLTREEKGTVGKGIEWMLLTTESVESFEQACQVIEWYTGRWMIEIYHQVLKSGCKIAERPFETAQRLERYLAIDSVVAWRIMGLTFQSRETPEMSCEAFLEPEEWQARFCYIHKTRQALGKPPSLREVARWIAKLGGFWGRKRDGEPGVTVMWRGLQRLYDIIQIWRIFDHDSSTVNCGER